MNYDDMIASEGSERAFIEEEMDAQEEKLNDLLNQ
jgi:hypothetical protein